MSGPLLSRKINRFRRVLVTGPALAAALVVGAAVPAPGATAPAAARPCAWYGRAGWIGSWEASPASGVTTAHDVASGHTLRQVVHLSLGGSAVRVRLSNRFGTSPLPLGHVTVAVQPPGSTGAAPLPGTLHGVRFGRARSAVIAAGSDLTSDAVALSVRPGTDLMVSVYLPAVTGPVTTHPVGLQTSYFSAGGDHAGDTSGTAFTGTTTAWHYLTGVDILSGPAGGSVVALGDSITDGNQSTVNADHRWPDLLADRLLTLPARQREGVLNAGISGNRLLLDGGTMGVKALDRLGEDVFSRTGVCTAVLLEGINDIQQSPHQLDPAKIESAYRTIVAQAHARGIRVLGATLLPFKGFRVWSPTLERTREAVNAYIRTSGVFGAVIDFDKVMRDPADPLRMRPAYDSGDHIHPNDTGYQAMARSVDLRLLIPG